MKKLIAALLILISAASISLAAKAVEWTLIGTTNEVLNSPSTGVYQDVGAKSIILTTVGTNCLTASYALLSYTGSGGTTLITTETLATHEVTTLCSPFFKVRTTASGGTIEGKGLIYIY